MLVLGQSANTADKHPDKMPMQLSTRGSKGAKENAEDNITSPSEGWRLTPEVPCVDDFVSVNGPRPAAAVDLPTSKEKYLESEYCKLRYEAIQPLRDALHDYEQNKATAALEKVNVYSDVRFKGFMLTDDGAAARITFSTREADEIISWETSKRLLPGTLVLLSSSNIRCKYLVGLVAYRFLCGGLEPDIEAGEAADTPHRIDLFFRTWDPDLLDTSVDYVMLESKSGYFESVRYAMLGLQQAVSEESLFDGYILGNKKIAERSNLSATTKMAPSTITTCLDQSQLDAFTHMTTKQLAIIQGPPGTGKTFTTVAAINQFVSTTEKPIIVAAQTNHAVDQLVQRCAMLGINRICRLGSRCSKEVEEFCIFALRETSRHMSRPAIQAITRSARVDVNRSRSAFAKTLNQSKMTVTAETLYDQGVLTTEQYNSLQSTEWDIDDGDGLRAWLNCDTIISTPTSQEGGRTQRYLKPDPYRPQGIFVELPAADIASKPSRSIEHQLSTVKDLYVIQPRRRHDIYLLMCHQLAKKYASQAAGQFLKYNECCTSLTYQKRIRDAALIKMEGVQVLACTVTGLSKYRTLIKELQPEVMLVDEASEAFESTIAVAALLPSLQQVSLVGDHQQLTPSPATELMKQQPYSLNVSLFERLVGYLDYKILLCQRRMVPNIRDIISEYYPDVHDHLSVSKRGEAVPGARNLWWFDHQWPETLTPRKSFCNFTEASMAVRLANHFIQAGVLAERITILTVYSGQVDAINKVIHSEDHGQARQVAVRTVDGFQGCENNLIILSLVRSHRPGFVADIHRATVALSRARDAMFVFGSVATLVQSNETSRSTWAGVLDRFRRQSAVGTLLSTTVEWSEVLEQITQSHEAIKEAQRSVDGRVPAAENETSSTQSLDHAGQGEKLSAIELILSKFDSEYIMKTGYAACVLEPKLAPLVVAPVATESGVYKGQGEFLIDMGAD